MYVFPNLKLKKITKVAHCPSLRWSNLKLVPESHLTIGEALCKEMKRNGHHSCKVCGGGHRISHPTPPAVKRV